MSNVCCTFLGAHLALAYVEAREFSTAARPKSKASDADSEKQIATEFRLETASRPYSRTLGVQFSYFQKELTLARKAGGIDCFHMWPEGRDVSFFLGTRHALKQAIEKATRDPADIHDPTLLAEMRRAVEESEAEIPTPDSIVFGAAGDRIAEQSARMEAARREQQALRRTAEGSLSAVLSPSDAAGGRRVVLRVVNLAVGTFYMDRRAINSGLELLLVDSKGNDVPINAKGRAMREYRAVDFNVRAAPITPAYSPRFELNLGDFFGLSPGETYTLHAEWTLEIHDEVNTWGPLDPVYKHRLALRVKPIQVQMPNKP